MRPTEVNLRLVDQFPMSSLIKVIYFLDHGFLELCPIRLFPGITIMHSIRITIVDWRHHSMGRYFVQRTVFQRICSDNARAVSNKGVLLSFSCFPGQLFCYPGGSSQGRRSFILLHGGCWRSNRRWWVTTILTWWFGCSERNGLVPWWLHTEVNVLVYQCCLTPVIIKTS